MEARRLQRQQEAEEELAAIARGNAATIAAVAARDERSAKSATIDIRDLERQKLSEIRKSVLGISDASQKLNSIFEEAVVKTALVSLDLSVDPHTISLPLLLLPLSHPIQALEIACVAGISCHNHRYPSQLLRATFVMAEIAGLVPRLASLALRLTLNDECRHGHFQSTSWSGIVCRSGFTEYKSLRQVILQNEHSGGRRLHDG